MKYEHTARSEPHPSVQPSPRDSIFGMLPIIFSQDINVSKLKESAAILEHLCYN